MTRSPLLLVAHTELVLAARSRWTQVFAAAFAVMAVGVAGSGYVLSGGSGFEDLARTSASLVQLVVLVVPLTAIVVGVLHLAPERGQAELLYSQPVSRATILLGRVAGLFVALASAQAVGFGAAGVLVFAQAGSEGGGAYALLVLASLLLTAVFLAVAALLSAGALGRARTRALALGVVVWLAATVLVDLGALFIATLVPSGIATRVIVGAVVANPAGAIRTGALLAIEGTAAFGAGSLALLRLTGGRAGAGVLLASTTAAWIVVPLLFAARRAERLEL
jgi:Cu-processing system permease protein